ncbi:MAG: prolyl oligopeptidase family serine peptidase [Planctomycetaceae bacterium]|nr:prolyl oligopeptidase family serine peptidase [Planctomycetaceae bacterium]
MKYILLVVLMFGSLLAGPTLSAQDHPELRASLKSLQDKIARLTAEELKVEADGLSRSRRLRIADIEVYAKAVEWMLRHDEIYKPNYLDQAKAALETGHQRAEVFAKKKEAWGTTPGKVILGYYSEVDDSAQPYALTLPDGFSLDKPGRWPLHVVLHGRAGQMNEVNFISRHDHKSAPEEADWIQLDVFGRTNNAYRWSGETDVFEALRDVQRRFRIDDKRITLHGFSMGGAGAWHLGLHYPSKWCSVGPGAGFVDTYKYQNIEHKLPDYQDRTLGIYDAIDYALNAYDVPICTYGGEKDSQLVASTSTVDAAKELGVDIKLLIGAGMGHKFDPESRKKFMAFHIEKSKAGRPGFPGRKTLRFTTRTLKYNSCEWITIAGMIKQYAPTIVEGEIDYENETVRITTENVSSLWVARGIGAEAITIDGSIVPLADAARNLLPDVLYMKTAAGWEVVSYDDTRVFQENKIPVKRHDLQGPIDDAFMSSFVCVRGTGKPWSQNQHDYAMFVLDRFEQEFDKWLRGKIRIVNDTEVTEEMMEQHHLILFGDPASNSILRDVLPGLPISWSEKSIVADGQTFDPNKQGLAMIYPNPLQANKYIVINSGHTFHEEQFKASNAQLYPRLGDFAIVDLTKEDGSYSETIEHATIFNGGWQFPGSDSKTAATR